jgi:hypothetical protein
MNTNLIASLKSTLTPNQFLAIVTSLLAASNNEYFTKEYGTRSSEAVESLIIELGIK